jgi:hypothetical protein
VAKAGVIRRHEAAILKGIALVSLLTLIVLGSTVLVMNVLKPNPQGNQTSGWQRTSEIRIVMDSTSDWARIMFNDLSGTNQNGIRVLEFGSHGWLLGNDSNDRIDAGHSLTFIDVLYNSTVTKVGDIVGFFKGNNDFHHTRMYVDVVLGVNMDLRQVYMVIMLAGAGTTTFQLINKATGVMISQDAETGNSYTRYLQWWVPPGAFFAKQEIETTLVVLLAAATIGMMVIFTWLSFRRKTSPVRDSEGL